MLKNYHAQLPGPKFPPDARFEPSFAFSRDTSWKLFFEFTPAVFILKFRILVFFFNHEASKQVSERLVIPKNNTSIPVLFF